MQSEFASTIKICELGLLCVGSTKAVKALKSVVKTEAAALLPAPIMVKHHLFNKFWRKSEQSSKYRQFFERHGINVDDYCVRIPVDMHRKQIHGRGEWTLRLTTWIDENPSATTKEVYQFMGKMMDDFKISGLPIQPYNK